MIRRAFIAGTLLLVMPAAFADMQQKRRAFIRKLIDRGVFQKVEVPGSLPHVWVKPAFYSLDFDTKAQFINVVYAYYIAEDPKYNIVVLFDSRTGKEIGKYAETYGGLKLY